MRRTFDVGSGLVVAGAAVLLVSLFLDWFAGGLSAWDAFELVDWLLAAAGIAAITAVAGAVADDAGPARWLPVVGAVALVLVVSQLVDPPPAVGDAERDEGGWLALAGAAAVAVGAALSLTSIAVSVDVRGRERRRRVSAVDRREDEDEDEDEDEAPPARPPGDDPDRTQPL